MACDQLLPPRIYHGQWGSVCDGVNFSLSLSLSLFDGCCICMGTGGATGGFAICPPEKFRPHLPNASKSIQGDLSYIKLHAEGRAHIKWKFSFVHSPGLVKKKNYFINLF